MAIADVTFTDGTTWTFKAKDFKTICEMLVEYAGNGDIVKINAYLADRPTPIDLSRE